MESQQKADRDDNNPDPGDIDEDADCDGYVEEVDCNDEDADNAEAEDTYMMFRKRQRLCRKQ